LLIFNVKITATDRKIDQISYIAEKMFKPVDFFPDLKKDGFLCDKEVVPESWVQRLYRSPHRELHNLSTAGFGLYQPGGFSFLSVR